ncbi:hypothetical protein ANO14919_031340 [Xylariales sp. No.14919]|nr:hypothetical protein ANO14919_031340 [Xylariales sp. No.14919]
MASEGLPVFVRLVPIMTTTSSLWYAWDQYEQITLFRHAELRSLSNQLLPRYFTSFFNRGAPRVLALLMGTTFSCAAILQYSPAGVVHGSGAVPWYVGGLSLAVAHLAWAPSIFPLKNLIEKDAKEKNVTHIERWLRLHVWRSLTVDLGAWICCIVATVKTLS